MAKLGQLSDPDILRTLLLGLERKEPESAIPLLLIGLGGTGADVLRRVKWRINWLGMGELMRFLIIDTDIKYKDSKGMYPGFEDHEFVLLSQDAASIVLENIDRNPAVARRFDLHDERIMADMRDSVEQHVDGAGQVRRNGALRFLANHHAVKRTLEKAIGHLNTKWKRFEVGKERLRPFNTIIVSSTCGGTGAGVLLEVASMLHHMLRTYTSKVFAFLTMPDVYDGDVAGLSHDRWRMRAMAYACLQELEWLRSSQAHADGAALSDQYKPCHGDPFSNVNLVSRIDALDKDLGSSEAVYDSIALYLSAFASQQMGAFTLSELCNEVRETDARLPSLRHWGTIGATGLSLPIQKLLFYCAFHAARDCTHRFVLGTEPDPEVTTAQVDTWLHESGLEERAAKSGANQIVDALRDKTGFHAHIFTSRLFRAVDGDQKKHLKDSEFVGHYQKIADDWTQSGKGKLRERIGRVSEWLVGKAGAALETEIDSIIGHQRGQTPKAANASEDSPQKFDVMGLRPANAFLRQLSHVLQAVAQELANDSKRSHEAGARSMEEAEHTFKQIDTWFGRLGTDHRRQTKIANDLRAAITAEANAIFAAEAQRIVLTIKKLAENRLSELCRRADAWTRICDDLDRRGAEHRFIEGENEIPFGASRSELSAMTPALAESLRHDHAMQYGAFVSEIDTVSKREFVEWVKSDPDKNDAWETIVIASGRHYARVIDDLSVLALLQDEAELDKKEKRPLHDRLRAVIEGCTPLWRIRHLNEPEARFRDSIAVGRASTNKDFERQFKKIVNECASALRFGHAQGEPSVIDTNDRQCVYALRRVSGGIPYLFPDWGEYREAYDKYQSREKHRTTHTVSRETVETLPRIEPGAGEAHGYREFAIAMALGWIAQRSKHYYFNLIRENSGAFAVPLNSQANCVPFDGGRLRDNPGCLQALVSKGLLEFKQLTNASPLPRLGGTAGGRERALRDFQKSAPAIELVNEVYDRLCTDAGVAAVCDDLERHADMLEKMLNKQTEKQLHPELELLRDEIERIRPRKREK